MFDEGEYQEQMVLFLGTDHTEFRATNEKIGTAFPDVLWHVERTGILSSQIVQNQFVDNFTSKPVCPVLPDVVVNRDLKEIINRRRTLTCADHL